VRGQRYTPAALYPLETPSTHCTGGWVGLRPGLDKCGKSRPQPGLDSRTVQLVAIRYTDWATRTTCLHKIMLKQMLSLTKHYNTYKTSRFFFFFFFFFTDALHSNADLRLLFALLPVSCIFDSLFKVAVLHFLNLFVQSPPIFWHLLTVPVSSVGRVSSVCIAISYQLHVPGIEPKWKIFRARTDSPCSQPG